MKLGTASASDRLQAFECEGKERPFDSRRPQQSLIGWTDPLCACISLISVFCAVARYFYSQDNGDLVSQPVHMLIPWFSACSRSNAGHNPKCVSLPGQSC